MFKLIKCIFFLMLIINLIGCARIYGDNGMIKNRDHDYLKAQSIPALKIPAGYASSSISPHYPIPARQYPESDIQFSVKPPELN